MITFQWNRNFVTGLPTVDREHQGLVEIINRLGNLVGGNEPGHAELDQLFDQLMHYARTHFSNEEHLMQSSGIDARHIAGHIGSHSRFLDDIRALRGAGALEMGMTAPRLLDYLVHWLSYHILGRDQIMARQMAAVAAGATDAEAFERHERLQDSVEPLLATLNGLLQELSGRNHELMELNRNLEQHVANRTSELSLANHKLEVLSETDALTGLPNRRKALRVLDELWRTDTTGASLAVLMIDADNFKPINDRFGHEAGDRVLTELARTLKHTVRTDDLVCRLGGDEFLAICPRTDLKGALHLADLLLGAVADLQVDVVGGFWAGAVSIGVAERTAAMRSYEDLIKSADEVLYRAKSAGRNCVRAPSASARPLKTGSA